MKKILIIIALALFSLMSCGRGPQLTFMVGGAPNELAYWEEVLDAFEKETGISVNMIRQASDTEQRKQSILIALRGQRPDPDVMLMDVAWIGQLASSEWLEPLDDYNIDASPFFPSIVNLADTYESQLVGLPVYVDGGLLYYRKDLLEKYGYNKPPAYWSELVEMAKKIQAEERKTNPNFWGYVWQGAQYEGLICNALEVFASAGGGFLGPEGNSIVNSPANVIALQTMVDFINKHKVSPPNTYTDMKEEEVRQMFQNGNALFERNWPYAYGLHRAEDSTVRDKFDTAPLPSFPGGSSASTLGGWHIGISRFSDMKEEAAKLVEFITSYETQKKLAVTLGWNPGRMDVYTNPEVIEANPNIQNLKEIFMGAIPRPTVPYYSQLSVILQRHLNAALAGNVEPNKAIEAAHTEISKVLEEYAK